MRPLPPPLLVNGKRKKYFFCHSTRKSLPSRQEKKTTSPLLPSFRMPEMSDDLLHPERLATLERIMTLYGSHLQVNDKIRIGIEGDPCSHYRSIDDAPSAVVKDILERRDDGFIRFRAAFEDSEDLCEFSNRAFDPSNVWELHPSQVDAFKDRVQRERDRQAPPPSSPLSSSYRGEDVSHSPPAVSQDEFRAMEDKVSRLSDKLSSIAKDMSERLATLEDMGYRGETSSPHNEEALDELRESERTFRETMASTIRALAGDTLRLARGEPVEFAHQYIDRYDMALEDRANQSSSYSTRSEYRGNNAPSKSGASKKAHESDHHINKGQHQEEKWDFYRQGESVVAKESSQLTDD